MKRILIVLVLLICTIAHTSKACDCGYLGSFVYSSQAADIVVYGKIIEYDSMVTRSLHENPYSMKFLIIEKLRGIEEHDTIIVWGDNGFECRPYIEHFKPNTEWILALNRLDYTGRNNYEISICGEFYVPVKERKVQGQIFGWYDKNESKTYNYEFIKNLIQNPLHYPLQRPSKRLKESRSKIGLEYMTYCDFLPESSLDIYTINKIINEELVLPLDFMSIGDSYLINARVIIDINGEFYFNGTYANYYKPSIEHTMIENQLDKILRNIGKWKYGLEAGKPVTAELIIPILLKK
ncbi:hypothetical protein [Carboxylicivirga sp. N1Y90]|uniref:hypothetical protein n=1 Tax=Carboxylicivirga fragile TaxID=3417571 RepID=UPI003D33F86C|nr:hypothetical protein [Marinilabiliaceae bacterium N1Y90]